MAKPASDLRGAEFWPAAASCDSVGEDDPAPGKVVAAGDVGPVDGSEFRTPASEPREGLVGADSSVRLAGLLSLEDPEEAAANRVKLPGVRVVPDPRLPGPLKRPPSEATLVLEPLPVAPASRLRLARLCRGRAPEAKADKDDAAPEPEGEEEEGGEEGRPDPAGVLLLSAPVVVRPDMSGAEERSVGLFELQNLL